MEKLSKTNGASQRQKQPRVAFAVDWLQVLCKASQQFTDDITFPLDVISPEADSLGNHRLYSFVEPKEFTHGYTHNRSVVWRGLVVAHVSAVPRNEFRDPLSATIKMANATLYCGDWFFILHDICHALGWEPIRISRCDLCADFNFFVGGLAPSTFLRKYVTKNKASYLRVGSNDFAVYGNKSNHSTIFNSIRWGSRSNGVSTYLYNKTKELNEKTNKPWIRNHWTLCGLSSTKDVWRVEISINSEGTGLKSLTDGVLHTLFVDDIATPEMARQMFLTYAAKYFRFKRTDPKVKYAKDLKDVCLINTDGKLPLKPCPICETLPSSRKEYLFMRQIEVLDEVMKRIDSPFRTTENLNALSKIKDIAEALWQRSERESRAYKHAREKMICRVSTLIEERKIHDFHLQSIFAMTLPEDRVRAISDAVARELDTIYLPSQNFES